MKREPKYSVRRDLTRDELAGELDLHPKTIARYDGLGAPHESSPKGRRYNAPEYRAWMAANGRSGAVGRPGALESEEMRAARLRKENALAAKYEFQVKREMAELVSVEDFRAWMGAKYAMVRDAFAGLACEVGPLMEGRDAGERQAIIDAAVGRRLDKLSAAAEDKPIRKGKAAHR